jgi:hypothetical protein
MKEASRESQASTATKEKRRTRLDSYSKEMWAGQDVTLKSVAFSISGRIRACLNTHYLPAETPSTITRKVVLCRIPLSNDLFPGLWSVTKKPNEY